MALGPFLPGCKTHFLCPGLPPPVCTCAASEKLQKEDTLKGERVLGPLPVSLWIVIPRGGAWAPGPTCTCREDVLEEARPWVSDYLAPDLAPGLPGCVTLKRSLNLPVKWVGCHLTC